MTPEEMELAIRVLQQKVERYEEASDTVDLWRVNGAESLLGGYGFSQIGQSFRFQRRGLQILAPDSEVVSFIWVDTFDPLFDQSADFPHVAIRATTDPSFGVDGPLLRARVVANADTVAGLLLNTQSALEALSRLDAITADTQAQLRVYAGATADGSYVGVTNAPFWLGVFTADPAVLSDGMIWYRSDTDKARLRADGTTHNLATETWVTAGFIAAGVPILGSGSELTIASGAVTATSGYHRIDTQSDDASDELDTINGLTTGQVIVIRAENAGRTVVIKNGTGNLQLDGATDFSLDDVQDTWTGISDGTNILEISRSDNG